jgi:hypothetical protein
MDVYVSTTLRSGLLHPQPRKVEVVAINRVALITQHFYSGHQKVVGGTPERWIVPDISCLAH